MKRSSFITIAAVAALLLTGCSAKNSSSECCSDPSQNTSADSAENNSPEVKTLDYDKAEYSSDKFESYSTPAFSFDINSDFTLKEKNETVYDLPSSSYKFDHKLAEKFDINSISCYMESTKYEEEACRKITESGNADNIYLEHYEHGDIYLYILSYSNGDTAKTEGCALKNGQILTVNAEYKTQDMTKIVPMIKDILDSAEYISDEELPSEVSTIENEFFKLSVEPKYICDNIPATDTNYNIPQEASAGCFIFYASAENSDQTGSMLFIDVLDTDNTDTPASIADELKKQFAENKDITDIERSQSEFKGISTEEITFKNIDFDQTAKYILFAYKDKIINIHMFIKRNSNEVENDFNELLDKIELK